MCKHQFPESIISSRTRAWDFRPNETNPKSAVGIATADEAPASTIKAGATVVVTDLEKQLDSTTAAKHSSCRQKRGQKNVGSPQKAKTTTKALVDKTLVPTL